MSRSSFCLFQAVEEPIILLIFENAAMLQLGYLGLYVSALPGADLGEEGGGVDRVGYQSHVGCIFVFYRQLNNHYDYSDTVVLICMNGCVTAV